MTDSMFSLAEMAALFASADGRPDRTMKVWNQLRNLHQRKLIKETIAGAPGIAARFSLEETCLARLLVAMVDAGIEGSELASGQIRDSGRRPFPDGRTVERTIGGLIAAVRDEKAPWVLAITKVRLPEDEKASYSARLLPAWEAARPINDKESRQGNEYGDPTHPDSATWAGGSHRFAGTFLAFVKLPASDLVRPLVNFG